MTETLTARRIDGLRAPAAGRIEVRDIVARGLTFRLTAAGAKSWSLCIKLRSRGRRFLIGEYPKARSE